MRHALHHQAEQALSLFSETGFLPALLSWPKFSVTSFLMVSRLVRFGIRPKTIIDVGANVGQFAVSAAKCFPEAMVHSYEPVPECYAELERTARRFPNICTSPLALGDTAGELNFHINSHTHSSSVLPLSENHKRAFPSAREVRTIPVRVSTLDLEYGAADLAGPVLLKIDVQGYEANVLAGAKKVLPSIDYVVVEVSFQPLYAEERSLKDIFAFLDGFGLEFLQPVSFLPDPASGKYLQMDALFGRHSNGCARGAGWP